MEFIKAFTGALSGTFERTMERFLCTNNKFTNILYEEEK